MRAPPTAGRSRSPVRVRRFRPEPVLLRADRGRRRLHGVRPPDRRESEPDLVPAVRLLSQRWAVRALAPHRSAAAPGPAAWSRNSSFACARGRSRRRRRVAARGLLGHELDRLARSARDPRQRDRRRLRGRRPARQAGGDGFERVVGHGSVGHGAAHERPRRAAARGGRGASAAAAAAARSAAASSPRTRSARSRSRGSSAAGCLRARGSRCVSRRRTRSARSFVHDPARARTAGPDALPASRPGAALELLSDTRSAPPFDRGADRCPLLKRGATPAAKEMAARPARRLGGARLSARGCRPRTWPRRSPPRRA